MEQSESKREGERDATEREPRILAVSGAKGGVGKSLIAANLALYLATIGRKVLLVDADEAGANAHTLLGLDPPGPLGHFSPPQPEFRRVTFAEQEPALDMPFEDELPEDEEKRPLGRRAAPDVPSYDEPIVTPIPNLSLLHARLDDGYRGENERRGERSLRARLYDRLREQAADYIVVDLGSGVDPSLLELYEKADLSLFIAAPEPTSMEQTYRFIRELFWSRLSARLERESLAPLRVAIESELGHAPPALDILLFGEERHESLATIMREEMESFRFHLLVNQARVRADLEIGQQMRSAALRRFGLRIEPLGYIEYDDTAWTCVRTRRPLLIESPGTKASRSIEKLARRLLSILAGRALERPLRTAPPHTHHDLLEVERGASDEEIRRAYKRAREIFDPQAMVVYGLFDSEGLEVLRIRLEEAYDVLLDPARRRPYEKSVFTGEEPPMPQIIEEELLGERPERPPIHADTEYTGELLRTVRIAEGIELRSISERTKISITHLKNIEADEFSRLPAPVYVRGFVTEYAKCVGLDHEQVGRSYLARYQRYLEERGEL